MGSTFGTLFRISTFGESHGGALGVVIDGCPPRLPLSPDDIQGELDRRRPGQSALTTQRKEPDQVTILSGVYQGYTLGTPIALLIPNQDAMPQAYAEMRSKFRPSHADFTYQAKFGLRNPEGGGRSSARETAARVAAGAIARKLLASACPLVLRAWVSSIHQVDLPPLPSLPSLEEIEATPVRCPHPESAAAMISAIETARDSGNSVGGIVTCVVSGLPPGLGDPVFDRLEADLAKAMLSLPATKGFEIGSGFAGTRLTGAEHNDVFENREGRIRTRTNRSGGVQGGISNGEDLSFRVAFKPTATILTTQETVDASGQPVSLRARGRHDPCVVPRAVPIVEAMTALVLVDHWLRHHAQTQSFPLPPIP